MNVKKKIRRIRAGILVCFLCLLAANALAGRKSHGDWKTDPIDNTYNVEHYRYTRGQNRDVRTYFLKDYDYSFLEDVAIPGMPDTKDEDVKQSHIFSSAQCPQGICLTDDYILITAYSDEANCKGELMVIDRESGTYLVTLGMDANSHLGGIAFDGENVWVCNSAEETVERISYDVISLMAAQNQGKVLDATAVVDSYEVKNTPSCITYAQGRLWIATHTKYFSSKLVAYHYDHRNEDLSVLSEYRIPAKVQGICFDEEDGVYLSTSYGRRSSSYLKVYDSIVALSAHPKTPKYRIEMPPCSEELDCADGMLYILFESAGEKYYLGTDGKGNSVSPLDRILCLPVNDRTGS